VAWVRARTELDWRMPSARAVRNSVFALAVSYFALWACAPIASGPPPAPMAAGREHELGGVASWTQMAPGTRGFLDADCDAQLVQISCSGPSLAAWYRFDRDRFDLTTQLFAGTASFAGASARVAYRVVQTDHVFVAPALQGGWLSGGVSVPVGVAVSPSTWLVFTPTAQLSQTQLLRGSAGVWHTGPRGFVFGVELGAGTGASTIAPFAADASVLVGGQLGAGP